jgi:hypothetical protein
MKLSQQLRQGKAVGFVKRMNSSRKHRSYSSIHQTNHALEGAGEPARQRASELATDNRNRVSGNECRKQARWEAGHGDEARRVRLRPESGRALW